MISKALLFVVALATGGGMLMAAAAPPAAAGDPVRGGKLFLQCAACHTVAANAPNAVGPNLNGVLGARAGWRVGYAYSPALTASAVVWDRTTLDAFITRPTRLVPGTKMAFAGVADARARADLIAYLATLKTRR